jgi:hypothetical protein
MLYSKDKGTRQGKQDKQISKEKVQRQNNGRASESKKRKRFQARLSGLCGRQSSTETSFPLSFFFPTMLYTNLHLHVALTTKIKRQSLWNLSKNQHSFGNRGTLEKKKFTLYPMWTKCQN